MHSEHSQMTDCKNRGKMLVLRYLKKEADKKGLLLLKSCSLNTSNRSFIHMLVLMYVHVHRGFLRIFLFNASVDKKGHTQKRYKEILPHPSMHPSIFCTRLSTAGLEASPAVSGREVKYTLHRLQSYTEGYTGAH